MFPSSHFFCPVTALLHSFSVETVYLLDVYFYKHEMLKEAKREFIALHVYAAPFLMHFVLIQFSMPITKRCC